MQPKFTAQGAPDVSQKKLQKRNKPTQKLGDRLGDNPLHTWALRAGKKKKITQEYNQRGRPADAVKRWAESEGSTGNSALKVRWSD